jgi:hypothetical protein
VATVVLILGVGWGADCFAGSGLAGEPKDERAVAADATGNAPAGAGVVGHPTDMVDVQADADTENIGGNAGPEAAEPPERRPGQPSPSKLGIGLKVSTLGVGVEAAVPLMAKLNVRSGVNFFQYDHSLTNDGIHYDGRLQFRSAEAHLDWYPFGGFHVSPGMLFYNGNRLMANASVPGGQNFTLNGTSYRSDPNSPVMGTGKLDFMKVSPSMMFGFGSLIPRNGKRFSFLFEFGGAYQGSARVALNLTGSVCDPTAPLICTSVSDPSVQANVQAQQQKITHDVYPYRFFPVVSLGVGFNF